VEKQEGEREGDRRREEKKPMNLVATMFASQPVYTSLGPKKSIDLI
jgi:hypothetical protein